MNEHEIKPREDLAVKPDKKTEKPPLYRVLILNDDYTTMDFVVHVLESIFHKSPPQAVEIMLHVHKKGAGVAGIYTREIAETKINQVHRIAHENQFPLKCIMEKE